MRKIDCFAPCLMMAGLVTALGASPASDSKSLLVTTSIGSRTSLRVSTNMLQFDVEAPGHEPSATVDFSAGIRTRRGVEIVLTIEPAEGVKRADDLASAGAISFAGEGEGTVAGMLDGSAPAIAGRWNGSGHRTGRVTFVLRGAAPGTYIVPVRLVLTSP